MVACLQTAKHIDVIEDTVRPMLLSLEWWQDVFNPEQPPQTHTNGQVVQSQDTDPRCADVVLISALSTSLAPSTASSDSSSVPPPTVGATFVWMWMSDDAFPTDRSDWFVATLFMGRFEWQARIAPIKSPRQFRCDAIVATHQASKWDAITTSSWHFVRFTSALCIAHTPMGGPISYVAVIRRAAQTVAVSTDVLTPWSLIRNASLPHTHIQALALRLAGVSRLMLSSEAEAFQTNCQQGLIPGFISFPVTVGSFPFRSTQLTCKETAPELQESRARAHLRVIGVLAIFVYLHQLLGASFDSTNIVLVVAIILDAPVWISARLLAGLVVMRILPHEYEQCSYWPDMLLVAIAALMQVPISVTLFGVLLCVVFDAFRAVRAWKRLSDQVFVRPMAPPILLLCVYDALILPLQVILWVAIPTMFVLMNESPYARVAALTIYLTIVPTYALFYLVD